MIINELFRDYLKFNGYSQSLSVFNAETIHAQPTEVFSRTFISKDLGINDENADIPLVYALISSYKNVCSMQQVLAPIVDRTPNMFETTSSAAEHDPPQHESPRHGSHLGQSPGRMNTIDLAMPASPEEDDESVKDYPPVIDIYN